MDCCKVDVNEQGLQRRVGEVVACVVRNRLGD